MYTSVGFFLVYLTHYQMTNFRLFQIKKIADDNFKFDEKGRMLSKRVENTVGKGELARYKQFLLFPVFSKGSFPRGIKRCQNGLTLYHTIAIFNPFPNKPAVLSVCCTSHLKTLCKMDKLLIMSSFSFSQCFQFFLGEISSILIKFEFFVGKLLQRVKPLSCQVRIVINYTNEF